MAGATIRIMFIYSRYNGGTCLLYKEKENLESVQQKNEKPQQYPMGARLGIYGVLLRILYEQGKLSRATYLKANSYVEEQKRRKEMV